MVNCKNSYYSSDSAVPPTSTNGEDPVRLSENAPAAKDTVSWQESLDKDLPGMPSAVYIGRSSQITGETETTKVSLY